MLLLFNKFCKLASFPTNLRHPRVKERQPPHVNQHVDMAAESPHTASAKKTLKKKKKPQTRKQYFDIGFKRFVMGFKQRPASICLTTTILKSNYGCIYDQLSKLLASELCAPARLDPDVTVHFAERFEAINYSASTFTPIVEEYVPQYNDAAKKFQKAFPKLTPVFWDTEPKSVSKDRAMHLLIAKNWRMAYPSLRAAAKASALKPEIIKWIKAASAAFKKSKSSTPKPKSKSKKPNPNSNSNNTHNKPLIRRGSMPSADVPAPCPKSVKKRAKSMGSIFDEHREQKDPSRDDSSTAPLSEISNSEADFDRGMLPIFESQSIASEAITESLAGDFPDEPNTMSLLPDKLPDPDKIEDADELQQFEQIPRLAEGEGQITVKNQSEKENLGEKDESENRWTESEKDDSEKGESEKGESEKGESEKEGQEDEELEIDWRQYSKPALVNQMKSAAIKIKELKEKFHKERNKAYQAKRRWTKKEKGMMIDLELEKASVVELKKKLKKERRDTSSGRLGVRDEAKRVKKRLRPKDITRLVVTLAKDNADAVSRIVAGEKEQWMRRVEKMCKQERDSWKNKVHWTITLELSGTTKRQHQAFRNALNTKKICQNKSGAQYI